MGQYTKPVMGVFDDEGAIVTLLRGDWKTPWDFAASLSESVTPKDFGGLGNGTADDRGAFAAADATGPFRVRRGQWRIGSNLVLTNIVTFEPGAVLLPDAGVTVTFQRPIDADHLAQIFGGAGTVASTARNQTVYAEWFGARDDSNGTAGNGTDNAGALAKAYAFAKNVLLGGTGAYRHADTIGMQSQNFGYIGALSGPVRPELMLDDATGLKSNIKIGDGVTQRYATVGNLVMIRAQLATAGAGIDCDHVGDITIDNVRVYCNAKIFTGIKLRRGIRLVVQDSKVEAPRQDCIYVEGAGAGDLRTIDVTISRTRLEGAGRSCLNVYDYVEGVFLENCILFNAVGALCNINASTDAAGLVSFKLKGGDFDTGAVGMFLNFVNNVTIDSPWVSNISGQGILIGQCDSVTIGGGQIYTLGNCIEVGGAGAAYCRNVNIGGGIAMLQGQNGIYLKGVAQTVNIGKVIISSMAQWAINKFENPDHVVIDGAMGRANTSGGISSGGTNVSLGVNSFV